jgi:hypothetical protein
MIKLTNILAEMHLNKPKTTYNDNSPVDIINKQIADWRKNPYDNYMDIFNKVVRDELDLVIMTKLLHVLKQIEDGEVDQHEGSVIFGKILKELYIDSAIKRGEKLDKEYEEEKQAPIEGKKINWKEYKNILR